MGGVLQMETTAPRIPHRRSLVTVSPGRLPVALTESVCGGTGVYLQPAASNQGQLISGSYSRRAGTDRTLGSTRGFDPALLGGGPSRISAFMSTLSSMQQFDLPQVRLSTVEDGRIHPGNRRRRLDTRGRGTPGRGGAISALARGVSGTCPSLLRPAHDSAGTSACTPASGLVGLIPCMCPLGGVNPQGRGGGSPPAGGSGHEGRYWKDDGSN